MGTLREKILEKIKEGNMDKANKKEGPAPTATTVDGAKGDYHHDKTNIIEISPDVQQENKTELDKCIDKLNKKHAVVMLGGKCTIMNEAYHKSPKHPEITFTSFRNFIERYRNIKNNNTSIGKIWRDSPKRRQYKKIEFAPGKNDSDIYNLIWAENEAFMKLKIFYDQEYF